MKATERYRAIFGELGTLAQEVTWTTGVSNMLEWLVWSTGNVLGVTKTQFVKTIVEWADDPEVRDRPLETKFALVQARLQAAITVSERFHRYDRPTYTIASAREALRRAKFFSEDYLNKEFDIFWGLVSDSYLDNFYSQFFQFELGGRWYSHGNSGLFACSTEISVMQMDNLSYNPDAGVLVANELKLGGRKNPDQILKYALMYRLLVEKGFVAPGTRFVMMILGDKAESGEWRKLIDAEIAHCKASKKSTAREALHPDGVQIACDAEYFSTTWSDLIRFNELYLENLQERSQQVERKLLTGFNETLLSKAFLNLGDRAQ